MGQLPLALALTDDARFTTFVPGVNVPAFAHVQAVVRGAEDTLWLHGPRGSGKTHLLQAACREAAATGRRAMYVPLGAEHVADPAILAGLEHVDVLALDGLDRAAGDSAWEQPLFVVLNEFLARGGLLLAAPTTAGACNFRLPDLASRAAGAIAYKLRPLSDADRVEALVKHADARGLELERPAAQYLLSRVDRDMAVLGRWLDRLDRASLVEQRRLTIPFIRRLLESGAASVE